MCNRNKWNAVRGKSGKLFPSDCTRYSHLNIRIDIPIDNTYSGAPMYQAE